MKFLKLLLGTWLVALLAACGGGGGSAGGNPNQVSLRTTAQALEVIAPGTSKSYTISGGVAPYSAKNSDSAIAAGSVDGTRLTIVGARAGTSTVSVQDYSGASVDISVKVGSSTPLSTTAPSSLSLALGPTAAQVYEIRGGVAPYSAVSGDPRIIAVSLNQAQMKFTVTGVAVGRTAITLTDGAGELVTIDVSTTANRPLVTTAPSSVVVAVGSTQRYEIQGGVEPYQVNSSNTQVLTAVKQSTRDLVVTGVSGGAAKIYVTDIAGGAVTIDAKVGSDNPLFTSAPSTVTMSISSTSPTYSIGGGAGPYTVTSSNAAVASAALSGVGFVITTGTAAATTANILIKDALGAVVSVTVNVTGSGGSTALEPATTIEVLASSNTLQSAGVGVDITAYVKNRLNVAMPNEPVTFTADSGLLQNVSAQTNASGAATAKLLVGSDKSNRAIRVTVRSGTASGFVTVNVVGTRVVLSGDAAVKRLGTATYSTRVLDSSGNGIPGAVVTLSSSLANSFTTNPVVTDALGLATSVYNATNAGTDTLTANALGALAQVTVTVSAIDFGFVPLSASDSLVPLGTPRTLTVRYLNSGVGVAGATVNFTSTRGTLSTSSAVTNGSGEATVNVSSTTSGPATVLAQIAGVGQASIQVTFVAVTPSSIVVQANPSAIPPNSGGSTLSQSTIESTVRDVNGNPVTGQQVNFNIISDLSGGSLSSPSALTDLNGKAQVQYVAGTTSTAVNGVRISATVNGTAITGQSSLTVNSQSLFITIGLGNEISNVDSTTYSKPFSVYLTDATGNPVGSQPVSVSVIPASYDKGTLQWYPDPVKIWDYSPGSPTVTCPNTDLNFNGIVDGAETSPLLPGNVVVATPSSATTDAAGRAVFTLQYGEQFAKWVTVNITARTTVAGTESVRTSAFGLTGLGSDYNQQAIAPAGSVSPFGINASCP